MSQHHLITRLQRSSNAIFKLLLENIEIVFPFLGTTTFFVLLVECVTYQGFFSKRVILLKPELLLFAMVAISILFVYARYRKNIILKSTLTTLFLQINLLMALPILISSAFLTHLENNNYPNYVFSQSHIHPGNTIEVVILSLFLVLYFISIENKRVIQTVLLPLFKFSWLQLLFFMFVFTMIFRLSVQQIEKMYILTLLSYKAISVPFEERFAIATGEQGALAWGYYYSEFIKKNTPESAIIFIPPQLGAWSMEGNKHYMLGFLYPRQLLQSDDMYASIPDAAEYVMVADGAWTGDDFGWPKHLIPKEKIDFITYIDRESHRTWTTKQVDFELDTSKRLWGIIKLKKD